MKEKTREILKWYADKNNYSRCKHGYKVWGRQTMYCKHKCDKTKIQLDNGERARGHINGD